MTGRLAPEILSLESDDIPDYLIWIDDGHAPESIIDQWATQLDPRDALQWQHVGDSLSIKFNDQVTTVPLQENRGDVYVTINSLKEALVGSYDIYLYSPSLDQTTHAFLLVSNPESLNDQQATTLRRLFEPLKRGKDYFSLALIGWPEEDLSESELEQIHEELFSHLSPESKTGNPDPLDMIDGVPHSDRLDGAKNVALVLIVIVALFVLAAFLL